ncbi:Sucrase/ferredoxin-like-domain-containing protein [Clohesyomyces aquaticus]|uniref:Sucrase/ferredoxin-like-domain-containing protein n=1 Tax=Clohesyomyces aquaticus TaxID=1231657 RepID=A0A1Y1ZS42_9PLEO|nr:Sucrase/ferredoxin-like-domain-containing protein [Clohesyomyces aquaticus]
MGPKDTTYKPFAAYKMTSTLKNLYYKLSPTSSAFSVPTLKNPGEFTKARTTNELFPTTTKEVDGEDCLHDCSSCSVKYPNKFTIDEDEQLYGHVKGWSTHLIVATGKSDWVRDVSDEKGSVMEAVEASKVKPSNGRLMLSASNIPVPDHSDHTTTVLLLPAFQFIDNVSPANTPELISDFVNTGPTNTSPLGHISSSAAASEPTSAPASESSSAEPTSSENPKIAPTISPNSTLKSRPCPHKYLILLCSQKSRDARCGQSAPLLRREFERILRPLGLYRDLHDERPGGVGIYFISHVGGHKFSANLMIYRKASAVEKPKQLNGETQGIQEALDKLKVEDDKGKDVVLDVNKAQEDEGNGEAAQCIWLARVRPEDCENIIRYTVLQGKVVKPERQLRGGFDRCKQLVSW